MSISYRRVIGVAGALTFAAIPLGAMGPAAAGHQTTAQHVLLLSVDGMHQSDLDFYVTAHPSSALAKLVHKGAEFTQAQTPVPSDSFPGMVAQVTGGNPSSTASTTTTPGTMRCCPRAPPSRSAGAEPSSPASR